MILHVKSAFSNESNEITYNLDTEDGFNKILSDFPQLRESMLRYNDLRLIAKDMAEYLGHHHIYAWVTE